MKAVGPVRMLTLAGVLLCVVVVVLGAYVRLTAAGLGCPDWPGCYGQLLPPAAGEGAATLSAYPAATLDVGKAWREMVHRYAAATLGFVIVLITAFAFVARGEQPIRIRYALVLLAAVLLQGMLGMLTVTWQLKPLVVTLHLIGGLATLAMLWWLWLNVRDATPVNATPLRAIHALAITALVILGVQIALGGWTSSNYAAVACPDFPACQGEWWPAADFRDAFVLWRGLGINYEGGVLEHPARIAIHLTHRVGAVFVAAAVALVAVAALRHTARPRLRTAAIVVLGALALQLTIGVLMVVEGFPLLLATAHNAGAALLVLATVTLLWHTRRSA
jgi:heme a synthase